MKRMSSCSGAGAPNLQDPMPAHLRWSWYNNNGNKVHNKCNTIESSSNQPPGPWKICLPGNQSLVPKSWELLLLSTGFLRGRGRDCFIGFGAGRRDGSEGRSSRRAPWECCSDPAKSWASASAQVRHHLELSCPSWVQTFPLGTLAWSVQCNASTLQFPRSKWNWMKQREKMVRLYFIIQFLFLFLRNY